MEKVSTKKEVDIAVRFADAVKNMDMQMLDELLEEPGDYQITDETTTANTEVNRLDADKAGFLQWLLQKRLATAVYDISFDQCLHCAIGNPVVLFNNGQFPVNTRDMSETSKTGLMLDITENKIKGIQLCFTFIGEENKCNFEYVAHLMQHYMEKGINYIEAHAKAAELYFKFKK